MDYNKLLKQDLIELLEKRSFSDLIYKEETQLRKLLLSQISDKDNEIKILTAELKKLKDLHIDKEIDFSDTLDDVHQHYLSKIEEKQTTINIIDSKLIHFFAQCQDDDSKELLFELLSNQKLHSTKQHLRSKDSVRLEDNDEFDKLDLDFDELDEELNDLLLDEDLDLDDDSDLDDDDDLDLDEDLEDTQDTNFFISQVLKRKK